MVSLQQQKRQKKHPKETEVPKTYESSPERKDESWKTKQETTKLKMSLANRTKKITMIFSL